MLRPKKLFKVGVVFVIVLYWSSENFAHRCMFFKKWTLSIVINGGLSGLHASPQRSFEPYESSSKVDCDYCVVSSLLCTKPTRGAHCTVATFFNKWAHNFKQIIILLLIPIKNRTYYHVSIYVFILIFVFTFCITIFVMISIYWTF